MKLKKKLIRSSTVTIRLDPKLRYLTGLAARKLHETLSTFIESCIKENLKKNIIRLEDGSVCDFIKLGDIVWDESDDLRIQKLEKVVPNLLNYNEEIYLRKKRDAKNEKDSIDDDCIAKRMS